MVHRMFVKLFAYCLLLVLASCASDSWFGTGSEEVVEGKRIAVLDNTIIITADPVLLKKEMQIPSPEDFSSWNKSQGYRFTFAQNIALETPLRLKDEISIGDNNDPFYLRNVPIIFGGVAYTIDAEGVILALSYKDGFEVLWKYEIEIDEDVAGNFINAGMILNDGALYVSSGYNKVLKLDASSGELLWQRSIISIARSSPDLAGNIVLVNTIDNRLYALDASDGGLVWTHSGLVSDVSMFGSTAPIARGDIVVVPYSSGELYGIHRTSGRTLWSENVQLEAQVYDSISDIEASPVLYKNKVVSIGSDGTIAVFEAKSGARLWQKHIGAFGKPWVVGDYAFMVTDEAKLLAIHLLDGKVRWVRQLNKFEDIEDEKGPISYSGPVMAGGALWLVASHGKLLQMSAEDGSTLSQQEVDEGIYLPPVVADNKIFLLTQEARLLMLAK